MISAEPITYLFSWCICLCLLL